MKFLFVKSLWGKEITVRVSVGCIFYYFIQLSRFFFIWVLLQIELGMLGRFVVFEDTVIFRRESSCFYSSWFQFQFFLFLGRGGGVMFGKELGQEIIIWGFRSERRGRRYFCQVQNLQICFGFAMIYYSYFWCSFLRLFFGLSYYNLVGRDKRYVSEASLFFCGFLRWERFLFVLQSCWS